MAIGNMQKIIGKDRAYVVPEKCSQTDRQTHSLQYFATASTGKVTKRSGINASAGRGGQNYGFTRLNV